jgi:hypothetical protein
MKTLPGSRFFKFFGGLECVGPSFAYVAQFVFLRAVWIRTQRAALACRRATMQLSISAYDIDISADLFLRPITANETLSKRRELLSNYEGSFNCIKAFLGKQQQ